MDQLFRFSGYDLFGYVVSGFAGLLALDLTLGTNFVLQADWSISSATLTVLGSYVVGHIVAMFGSTVIERLITDRLLGHPVKYMLADKDNRALRGVGGSIAGDFFAPLARVHREALQKEADDSEEALFQRAFAIANRDQFSVDRRENFLILSAVTRHLAFVSLVTGLVVAVQILINDTPPCAQVPTLPCWAVSVVALVFGFGMYLRYLKFRRHFTKEVILTYLALSHLDEDRTC